MWPDMLRLPACSLYSWFSGLQAKWKGLANRHTFSASNFASAVYVDTVYRACSSCMNPRAGPECVNFARALTVHVLQMFLSPVHCKILALSWLMCVLCSAHVLEPKLRDSGPRLDAEATVRDSFPTYCGTVYAKIDAEIRIQCVTVFARYHLTGLQLILAL